MNGSVGTFASNGKSVSGIFASIAECNTMRRVRDKLGVEDLQSTLRHFKGLSWPAAFYQETEFSG